MNETELFLALMERCPNVWKRKEEEIKANERERTVKEIAKASSSKELNENIDYCMQTISLCEMTTERRKELCETLLSQRAMLTEFEKQIRADAILKFAEWFNRSDYGLLHFDINIAIAEYKKEQLKGSAEE